MIDVEIGGRSEMNLLTDEEIEAMYDADMFLGNCKENARVVEQAIFAKLKEQGYVVVPREPTEEQWGELARDIIMWMDMGNPTPRRLFDHMKILCIDPPKWLVDEPEMNNLDHVPSKGTRAVIIYRSMIEAGEVSLTSNTVLNEEH